jgi:hypothetical protein
LPIFDYCGDALAEELFKSTIANRKSKMNWGIRTYSHTKHCGTEFKDAFLINALPDADFM